MGGSAVTKFKIENTLGVAVHYCYSTVKGGENNGKTKEGGTDY